MSKYDFGSLSDIEFEDLTQDLLQSELNVPLESFKCGKDGGVDLRFCEDKEEILIVQCKHYQSGYKSLYNSLKKELPKVKKLNPKRYLLATSTRLSRENKKQILELFSGYIKRQKDIYGCEDLNRIIRKNKDIEKNHFKLWFSSVNILEKILHNNINNRSQDRIEQIQYKIKKYVENKSFGKAEKILDETNYVIISGSPGIGKSTLAEFIIWHYLAKDFEFIEISSDIEEAWTMLKPDSEKQVFYYDDFLGKTNFNISLTSKNEDKRLIQFIEKVQKSKNKKFLLTTREYIYKKAKSELEYLDSYPLKKCIIPLSDYTNTIKAKILYNHLYFSDIPYSYIKELLANNNYLTIINHKNYNPRIIEYSTTLSRLNDVNPNEYYSKFIADLQYPKDIWNHIYNKINNVSKAILLSIITGRYYIQMEKLYKYSESFYRNISKKELTKTEFKSALKVLEGDFISISKTWDESLSVSLINPSLQDFLEGVIKKENEQELILNSLEDIPQFEYFFNTFLVKEKDKVLLEYFFRKLKEKCIIESSKIFISSLTLMLKSIRYLEMLDLLSEIEEYLKAICNLNVEITLLEGLFEEIENFDFNEIPVLKNFIISYKNLILENILFFNNYYDNIESYKQINNFISIFGENIFAQKEQEVIKNEIISAYEIISDSIEKASYDAHEFKNNLNSFKEMIELFNIEDENVISELSYLNERQSEIEKEQEQEEYIENRMDNSLSKDKLASKVTEMTEKNITEMFESLKYSKK